MSHIQSYPSYKDSEIEWIGMIPENWQVKRLATAATDENYSFVDGPFGSDLKNEEYTDEGVPLIQLNNIGIGSHLLNSTKFVSEQKSEQLKKHTAESGDIVIAKMAEPVARATIVDNAFTKYVIVADCIKLKVNRSKFNPRYIVYSLNSYMRAHAELLATGTTRLRINLSTLKSLKILVPSLEEQNQIVLFLDRKTTEINTLIADKQRLIELLQERRRTLITDAVTKGLDRNAPMRASGIEWIGEIPEGWVVAHIRYAFEEISSGTTPPTDHEEYYDGDINWVLTGDLNDGDIYKTTKQITHEALTSFSALRLYKPGTLLIAMYGATIGKLGILHIPAATNQACCALSKYKYKAEKYVFYYLLCMREQLIAYAVGGGQPNINQQLLKSFPICLPSSSEQEKIVEFLDGFYLNTEMQISELKQSINHLQDYRQSLITEAVTGKINVTEEAT